MTPDRKRQIIATLKAMAFEPLTEQQHEQAIGILARVLIDVLSELPPSDHKLAVDEMMKTVAKREDHPDT